MGKVVELNVRKDESCAEKMVKVRLDTVCVICKQPVGSIEMEVSEDAAKHARGCIDSLDPCKACVDKHPRATFMFEVVPVTHPHAHTPIGGGDYITGRFMIVPWGTLIGQVDDIVGAMDEENFSAMLADVKARGGLEIDQNGNVK